MLYEVITSAQAQAVIAAQLGQQPGFEPQPISDQQIIDRMMIPMCLEAFLCLDEGIVGSAAEVDMGLILGLGFPKFRGGALRYIDHCGLDAFAQRVDALAELGPLYQLPPTLRERCQRGQSFF